MRAAWNAYVYMCQDILQDCGPTFGAFLVLFTTLFYVMLAPITLPLYLLGRLLEKVFGVKGFPG